MASMTLKTSADAAIAGGAAHWVAEYSSKYPQFLHSSKVTMGNEEVTTRFGSEEYNVRIMIRTETLAFYEAIIGYHAAGTQFRLNNTTDLGDLLLETIGGKSRFARLEDVKGTIVYYMELVCKLITEGL